MLRVWAEAFPGAYQYDFDATEALVEATESAFELDDIQRVEELLAIAEGFPLIQHRPFLDAQTARLGANLAARRGEPAEDGFEIATQSFRELEMPYWVGVTLHEHAENRLLTGSVDDAEPLLTEAQKIFERLRAEPMLQRIRLVQATKTRVHG